MLLYIALICLHLKPLISQKKTWPTSRAPSALRHRTSRPSQHRSRPWLLHRAPTATVTQMIRIALPAARWRWTSCPALYLLIRASNILLSRDRIILRSWNPGGLCCDCDCSCGSVERQGWQRASSWSFSRRMKSSATMHVQPHTVSKSCQEPPSLDTFPILPTTLF